MQKKKIKKIKWSFLGGSVVKNPPAMQDMWI